MRCRCWRIFLSYHFQHGEVTLEVTYFWLSHCQPFRIFEYYFGKRVSTVIQGSNGIVCLTPPLLSHGGDGSSGQNIFVLLHHNLTELVPHSQVLRSYGVRPSHFSSALEYMPTVLGSLFRAWTIRLTLMSWRPSLGMANMNIFTSSMLLIMTSIGCMHFIDWVRRRSDKYISWYPGCT